VAGDYLGSRRRSIFRPLWFDAICACKHMRRYTHFHRFGAAQAGIHPLQHAFWVVSVPQLRALLHTLPRGFVRIRFCGFLANRRRGELLPVCRRLLQAALPQNSTAPDASASCAPGTWLCPHCGGAMVLIEKLTPQQMLRRSAGRESFADTS
jgi:hypothetical protein